MAEYKSYTQWDKNLTKRAKEKSKEYAKDFAEGYNFRSYNSAMSKSDEIYLLTKIDIMLISLGLTLDYEMGANDDPDTMEEYSLHVKLRIFDLTDMDDDESVSDDSDSEDPT